jgi:hypothetical protein
MRIKLCALHDKKLERFPTIVLHTTLLATSVLYINQPFNDDEPFAELNTKDFLHFKAGPDFPPPATLFALD